MSMREIVEFASRNPACWLATSVAGQPHVRGLLLWYADAQGFHFHTATTKRLARELRENPRVEIAFFEPSRDGGRMMRVTGQARFLDAAAHRARLVAERPWVAALERDLPGSELAVFVVEQGEVQRWSMAVNGREAEQPTVRF